MPEQRYTLSLPIEIYQELKTQADKHDISIKDAVRQCLKFGLVAIRIAEDPDADLIIREKVTSEKGVNARETRLEFVW